MHPKGYISIASLVLITALIVLVTGTVSILGVDEAITSLSVKEGLKTLDFVAACAEDAILTINESGTTPSSVTLPLGTCAITNASTSGTLHSFTITGTQGNHTRAFTLEVDRQLVLKINKWQEN